MVSRLVPAFVLLFLALVAVIGAIRSYNISTDVREREATHAAAEAEVLADLVNDRDRAGLDTAAPYMRAFLTPHRRIAWELRPAAGGRVQRGQVAGKEFSSTIDDSSVSATSASDGASVTVVDTQGAWAGVTGYDVETFLVTLALAALGAAAAAWVMVRWIMRPFTRLAVAAESLGRGRFDLELPRSRIREVQAVTAALEASASALRGRLAREQQFSAHASHLMRTPLTSLRLHLDELEQHDLGAQAAGAVHRCQDAVLGLDVVVADLVDLTRRGALMEGAEVPLRDLAAGVAQTWADDLAPQGRDVSAAVEGDLDLMLTPGPVEYVLDVLLERATLDREATGEVRLVLVGAAAVLRVEVTGVEALPALDAVAAPGCRVAQARSLVDTLGGRLESLPDATGVRLLLPPR